MLNETRLPLLGLFKRSILKNEINTVFILHVS